MWPESSSVKPVNLVKNYYSNRNNEYYLRGCFLLAHPVHVMMSLIDVYTGHVLATVQKARWKLSNADSIHTADVNVLILDSLDVGGVN